MSDGNKAPTKPVRRPVLGRLHLRSTGARTSLRVDDGTDGPRKISGGAVAVGFKRGRTRSVTQEHQGSTKAETLARHSALRETMRDEPDEDDIAYEPPRTYTKE